jgi:hypothetical protein
VSFFYRAMLDVRRLETEKQMKSLELLVLRSKIIICCTWYCHLSSLSIKKREVDDIDGSILKYNRMRRLSLTFVYECRGEDVIVEKRLVGVSGRRSVRSRYDIFLL